MWRAWRSSRLTGASASCPRSPIWSWRSPIATESGSASWHSPTGSVGSSSTITPSARSQAPRSSASCRNTNLILDAGRAEGRVGYNRAARALLEFQRSFWIANLLHRTLRLARPLQRQISIRFETLLIRRLALEELFRFIDSRLAALLGQRVAELLVEVIAARNEATIRALDALRLQYPEHAEALEQRFLRQSGFRLSLSRFHDLYDAASAGQDKGIASFSRTCTVKVRLAKGPYAEGAPSRLGARWP